MSPDKPRRTFIASLGAIAATALFRDVPIADAAVPSLAAQQTAGKWDLSWLDSLKGKHRQVFDLGSRDLGKNGNPLRVPKNYLNAHNTVYGLSDAELSTIVGIAGEAFAMNASDRLWREYSFGEFWQIKDPATGQFAVRNFFVDAPNGGKGGPPSASIQVLLGRGTIFWQCNNALNGLADEFAAARGKESATVRADFVAGLNPWVKLVPAHTMLLGLAQERGFTYEKL